VDILDLLSVLLQGPSSGISIPSWRWVVLFLVVAGLLTAVVLLAPTEERNKRGQVVYCVLAVAAGVGILSHYYALLPRRDARICYADPTAKAIDHHLVYITEAKMDTLRRHKGGRRNGLGKSMPGMLGCLERRESSASTVRWRKKGSETREAE
jgi:hypothetical protein